MGGRELSKLRTFIAIDPPAETKEEIAKIIETLKKKSLSQTASRRIIWEDPQKFHFTLVFLGHIPQEKMEVAANVAREVAQNFPKFTLTGGSSSYFLKEKGSLDSVIFLNILDPEKILRILYKALFKLLAEAGFYPPERLSPHITIARLRGKHLRVTERKRILSYVADIDIPILKPFLVSAINVYESIPNGNSTRYHLLKSFPLGT
ncbi:MAG: RNA 2',3'-cyclic phosphodiesterase [bacterium]|nr:RNA 2',3'-cyclic phosphodiesterase [bacterium]